MLKRVALNISTSPLRYIGGAQGQPRQMWSRTERLNQGHGVESKFSGVPSGHLHPSSWILPYQAGAMSSRKEANIVFTSSANGAQGLNASGSSSILFTTSASGQAVASGVGSASIVFTTSATGVAPLNAVASTSITFTASGTMIAPATLSASATITFSGAAQTFAAGFMTAVPISQELTADQIALAVWAANAAANNTAGTMGEKLNDAGSASNPWTEVLEGTYTAADMLRIVSAVLAGNITGAGTGTETLRSLTDDKDRVVATIDEDGNRTVVSVDGT